jgi:hypothetical protein
MERTCATCKHYVQHYVQHGRRYGAAYCGHCRYPRLKSRKPDTPACDKFAENRKGSANKS